ncbi:MAG: DctP family TRAP transporter solute-binding subunit [Austwickia sp.]|nr:DctP family TRAP transporter solute-binding subunit [Austwickia sp.]MBK8436733.1 DctP family TRAP transporter solute-binding subunit [Austwickia sp.]
MVTKRPVLVGVVVASALALAACGGARSEGTATASGGAQKYTIKFSHVVAPSAPKGKAALKFKELAESKSGGRLEVQVFSNSELYGDKDEFQALQSNSAQMLAPSTAKFTTVAPEVQVLDLPFLFDKPEDIAKIAAPETKVGKAIFDNQKLAAKNMKPLGLWDAGLKHLSSNKPMKSPADLAGLKMRIQPSDVLKVQFQTWKANPTPMAFSEVYNAMQQGVVDGGENPWSNIESQKMHTVQKHITESGHGYLGYILVINNTFYNGLPDDLKKVVTDAAKESGDYNRQVAEEVNQESKKKIQAAGTTTIYTPTDAERKALKDAVVPAVWNQFKDLIGAEIIDELLKAQAS